MKPAVEVRVGFSVAVAMGGWERLPDERARDRSRMGLNGLRGFYFLLITILMDADTSPVTGSWLRM